MPMSMEYTMQEMPDMRGEGKTILYPKVIIKDCCDETGLAEQLSEKSSFNTGDVKGLLTQLAKEIAFQMAQGRSVKIEGLGTFTPALALRKGKEREEKNATKRNAASIRVSDVNFRPDRKLVQEVNLHSHMERASEQFHIRHSKYTPEERLTLAQQYLETHPMLTVATYASLTGLGKTTAGTELRRWYKMPEAGIDIQGIGSHRVYIKKG